MQIPKVVVEHRESLSFYEDAVKKQRECQRKGCAEEYCTCDADLTIATMRYNDATEALNEYNAQRVAINDAEAILQIKKREMNNEKREKRLQQRERAQALSQANDILKAGVKVARNHKDRRDELTKEKYLHHKNVENLSDLKIADMYSIPRGSITGVKKKMFEKDTQSTTTQTPVIQPEKEKPVEDAEEQPVPESKVIALTEHIKVVSERDGLKDQFESLTVKFNQLAKDSAAALDEAERANDLKVETIKALEQDIAALQAQNCGACETNRQNLQDVVASNQSLIGRAGELTHRNNELEAKYRELEMKYNAAQIQHEEAIEAYEDKLREYEEFHKNQMKQWRAYERMILGRNLVLSKEVDKLEKAVESYEVIEAQATNQLSNVVDLKAAE